MTEPDTKRLKMDFSDDDGALLSGDEFEEYSEVEDDISFTPEQETEGSPSLSEDKGYEEKFEYQVLSTEQIVQHMNDCIKEANVVLQLPPTVMRMLLQHFRWDREKLLDAYFERNTEKLFSDAHIVSPSIASQRSPSTSTVATNSTSAENEECDICCDEKPPSMMYEISCGHRACRDCWSEYLTTKIMDDGMGQSISCVAFKCPILVDDASVMQLVTDSKVKLRYQHFITESFVQANRLMKWCPNAGCTNVIQVEWSDWKPVTCTCNHTFCFLCGEKWHDPVKCNWLKKWYKKCQDDSETANWIVANTKECPKCHATIQKIGGCNRIMCRNANCCFEFCWTCLAPWPGYDQHQAYSCNKFDEKEALAAKDAQEKSRAALKRYLHYHDRYQNHRESLKFESKLHEKVSKKMEEMQARDGKSWIEVQFLKKAVDTLCKCRETLMFTYAFAFFVQKNSQSIIFEDNQNDLESATEQLSEYLERDIDEEEKAVDNIMQRVKDKLVYCDSRRQVLVEHVYEGYENDWWAHIDEK